MNILQICAQCSGKFFEVSPDETETAELMVEDMMSQLLLVLFGGGMMDEVTIDFSPGPRMGLFSCSIQILAQCSCQHFAFFPCTKEQMQRTVKKSAESLLGELFIGSVEVESVMLSPSASDSEHDPVPFWHR
jgi:hypothetical protein